MHVALYYIGSYNGYTDKMNLVGHVIHSDCSWKPEFHQHVTTWDLGVTTAVLKMISLVLHLPACFRCCDPSLIFVISTTILVLATNHDPVLAADDSPRRSSIVVSPVPPRRNANRCD